MEQRFEPRNPEFESRVRESFARQAVMGELGAELVRVDPGRVDIRFPFRRQYTQQHGFLHAGIVAAVLDSACGYAAFSLMPADAAVLSVEFKINLLAPARGDSFLARGEVLRPGRTITVCHGSVAALAKDGEVEVAMMQATMMAIHGREGIDG
jgi:uncharacterized protein (TIGR00369 family)